MRRPANIGQSCLLIVEGGINRTILSLQPNVRHSIFNVRSTLVSTLPALDGGPPLKDPDSLCYLKYHRVLEIIKADLT